MIFLFLFVSMAWSEDFSGFQGRFLNLSGLPTEQLTLQMKFICTKEGFAPQFCGSEERNIPVKGNSLAAPGMRPTPHESAQHERRLVVRFPNGERLESRADCEAPEQNALLLSFPIKKQQLVLADGSSAAARIRAGEGLGLPVEWDLEQVLPGGLTIPLATEKKERSRGTELSVLKPWLLFHTCGKKAPDRFRLSLRVYEKERIVARLSVEGQASELPGLLPETIALEKRAGEPRSPTALGTTTPAR